MDVNRWAPGDGITYLKAIGGWCSGTGIVARQSPPSLLPKLPKHFKKLLLRLPLKLPPQYKLNSYFKQKFNDVNIRFFPIQLQGGKGLPNPKVKVLERKLWHVKTILRFWKMCKATQLLHQLGWVGLQAMDHHFTSNIWSLGLLPTVWDGIDFEYGV